MFAVPASAHSSPFGASSVDMHPDWYGAEHMTGVSLLFFQNYNDDQTDSMQEIRDVYLTMEIKHLEQVEVLNQELITESNCTGLDWTWSKGYSLKDA